MSFEFKGNTCSGVPRVITLLKARKLLYQGVWAILASVTKVGETVSSVPVVRKFVDVFLEELSRLPLPRSRLGY